MTYLAALAANESVSIERCKEYSRILYDQLWLKELLLKSSVANTDQKSILTRQLDLLCPGKRRASRSSSVRTTKLRGE